jgi:hypothetical protein
LRSGKYGRGLTLTTLFLLAQRLRMHGFIAPVLPDVFTSLHLLTDAILLPLCRNAAMFPPFPSYMVHISYGTNTSAHVLATFLWFHIPRNISICCSDNNLWIQRSAHGGWGAAALRAAGLQPPRKWKFKKTQYFFPHGDFKCFT